MIHCTGILRHARRGHRTHCRARFSRFIAVLGRRGLFTGRQGSAEAKPGQQGAQGA